MEAATKKKIDAMTNQQREKRLAELNDKHEITNPRSIAGGGKPSESDSKEFLQDMEERDYLMRLLGYSTSAQK